MKQGEYEKLRAAFMKEFASVPGPLRDQIVVAMEGKPYTWNSVFAEVNSNTEAAKEMLQKLKKIGLLE